MTQKRIYTVAIMTLCVIMLFMLCLLPTLAKFISTVKAPTEEGDFTISFTSNNVLEVQSEEELFAAINHGYSFIQIDQNVQNPLIVTETTNLNSDLIIDLNGIEIQRNGSDPILNVMDGVRLTITDTSDEQTGALYNPVGSVFNIIGGTLSVINGTFESGPRYSEYYSYNTLFVDDEEIKRTIVDGVQEVMFTQNGSSKTMTAPIIVSYPKLTGGVTYTHGNLYFDREYTVDGSEGLDIPADTYCYYHSTENAAAAVPDDASWYYTYHVNKADHTYHASSLTGSESITDYPRITIYGYEGAVAKASEKAIVADYYAAIRMQSGSLEIQDGWFASYFGSDKTACVNATGGSLIVKEGHFSTRVPNATTTAGGLTERGHDIAAFNAAYFDNFTWQNTTNTGGAQARAGAGLCILNSGEASVLIENGQFYSSNNNSIKMAGGLLYIGAGTLTKNHTLPLAAAADSGAAIFMTDGNLSLSNMQYTVNGDYTRAIVMQNGKLSVDNCTYTVTGKNTYGIYSTVSGADNFTVSNTSFTLTGGNNQVGIYAANGAVELIATSPRTISLSGANGKAVYATGGGKVTAQNYSFTVAGDYSTGIHSEGGNVTMGHGNLTLSGTTSFGIYSAGGAVSVNNSAISLASNNTSYGVYAATTVIGSDMHVTLTDTTVNVGYDSGNHKTSGTVAASVGVFLASPDANDQVLLKNTSISCYEIAVALSGGTLNINGNGSILTKRASAIAVAGGSLTFDADSTYTVTSYNTTTASTTNAYNLTLPKLSGGAITATTYPNTDGIYVEGGTLTANGTLNLTHTGLNNVTGYATYADQVITSYAMRVSGGDVTVTKGTITANAGGGICCTGGDVTVGDATADKAALMDANGYLSGGITVQALGTAATVETYHAMPGVPSGNWKVPHSINGGHAIELNGGNITVHNGTYTTKFGNAVTVNGDGIITLYNGKYFGGMPDAAKGKSGPGSCYGIKAIGGATTNIYNGHFDGGNGGAFVTGITSVTIPYNPDGLISCNYTYEEAGVEKTVVLSLEILDDNSTRYRLGDGTILTRHYKTEIQSGKEVQVFDYLEDPYGNPHYPAGDHEVPYTIDGDMANCYVYRGTFGNPSGSDAFNIYDLANVIFGAHNGTHEDSPQTLEEYKNAIQLYGAWTSIAMNNITNNNIAIEPTVTVYYGTYDNNGNLPYSVFNANCLTVYNTELGYVSMYDTTSHHPQGDREFYYGMLTKKRNASLITYPNK